MININPFDSPEVREQILKSSGYNPPKDVEDIEVLEEVENPDLSEFKGIISGVPSIPKAGSVRTLIKDTGALLKETQEAKAEGLNMALSDVMTKYNQEFGLDLHIDFGSLSRTLVACADTKKQETLQLYVSKIFRGIRPLILLNMISKLTLALDVILAPENLLNKNELSLTDLFVGVDTILGYIQKLEDMKDSILIDQEDLNLKRIAQENNMDYSESDEQMISDFIALFKKDNGINS